MSHFTLTTGASVGTTSISNIFLDEYMPGANGEYVKVYLYLLRSLGDSTRELSVIGLADVLDCTESDILRAFKYWEKQGLLKLECNASNVLLGIYLCEPSHLRTAGQPDRHASVATPGSSPVVPSVASASAVPERKAYSRDQLREFTSQSDCRQLLFVCEQYMKKTLTTSEIETLLYFYDQLHFSVDLVEYLVEYCVCKGSSSIHYIEKVGLAWAEAGITTVSQAKERTTTYRRNTFAIMKAFGINDRNPVQPELDYIEKWLGTYDFTLDLVLEACRILTMRTRSYRAGPKRKYIHCQMWNDWIRNIRRRTVPGRSHPLPGQPDSPISSSVTMILTSWKRCCSKARNNRRITCRLPINSTIRSCGNMTAANIRITGFNVLGSIRSTNRSPGSVRSTQRSLPAVFVRRSG